MVVKEHILSLFLKILSEDITSFIGKLVLKFKHTCGFLFKVSSIHQSAFYNVKTNLQLFDL